MTVNLALLAESPLFNGVDPADLEVVLESSSSRKAPQGTFFFFEQDPADRIYILTKGKVKLTQVTPNGQQVILRMVPEWEVFGLIALTENATYPVTAEAVSDCEVISWDRQTLAQLSKTFPRLAFNTMEYMTQRLRDFQDRVRELSTEKVERRLARLLLRLVRQAGQKTEEGVLIDLAVTRQDLAEMSGTTIFTVSRILSQWEREGIIDAGRERVLIRFPHGLVRIAEDLPDEE